MAQASEKASLTQTCENPGNTVPGNFRWHDQSQTFFITVTKDGFIEDNQPVVIIDAIAQRLDLSALYQTYSDEGNKAFHPKMMLKILMLCKELDMIGFEHLAIDGEKIQANASFKNSKNLKQVKSELERLETGIKKMLEQEVNEQITEEKIGKRVNTLETKIEKLKGLQKQLDEIGDEKKRINTTDPEAPVMRLKDSRSRPSYNHQTARDEKCGVVTAVETTLSVDKPEDLLALADQSVKNTGEYHKNITADCGFHSYPNLEKMETRPEEYYVPDRQFENTKGEKDEEKKYGQDRFQRNEDGTYFCPTGKIMKNIRIIKTLDGGTAVIYQCKDCWNCIVKGKCTSGQTRQIVIDTREPLREKMRQKLKSDEGREIYMKRQGLIEPIHGDDQKNNGWTQHLLRGFRKAKGEFILIRLVQNLRCIVKHMGDSILAYT